MKDSLYMLLQYSLENSLDFYSYYDTKTEMELKASYCSLQEGCAQKQCVFFSTSVVAEHKLINSSRTSFYFLI